MADPKQPIIIIKKIKKVAGGHHGGAWKVAYADFVTAMMAFFLLLWLLNVTTSVQRAGIADYFSPVSISESPGGAGGLFGGRTMNAPEAKFSDTAPPGMDSSLRAQPPGRDESENDDDSSGYAGNAAEGDDAGQGTDKKVAVIIERRTVKEPAEDKSENDKLSDKQMDKATKQREEEEKQKFKMAQEALQGAIAGTPDLAPLVKSLMIDQTEEGLRIQIVDQENYSMFPSGSAQMYPQTRKLIELVGKAVSRLPNKLAVTGHTDAAPFAALSQRDNWDLSAERANASRRVLLGVGVDESRIQTVVGRAARDPYVKENPNDPRNRRISIVLLRQSYLQQEAEKNATLPADTNAGAPAAPTNNE
jgi:chemotaxis protein MotB